MSTLSRLEQWTLANIVMGGQTFQELPVPLSSRVNALALKLQPLNYPDRQLIARNTLTAKEWKQLLAVDPAEPRPIEHSSRWNIYSIDELKNLPPVKWIIQHEVPEDALVILFGESGVGKSFLAIDYAMRISLEYPVVYIPTEGVSGYGKRVAAWMKHHVPRREPNIHFIAGQVSLYERGAFEDLKKDLHALKPKVVFVDTLAMAAVGMDENSARDMGIVLAACRALQHELKTTVVLVHHVGAAGLRERGSTALRGNADVMIRVSPADDLIMIECSKTKDEDAFPTRFVKRLPIQTEKGDSSVMVEAKQVIPVKGYLSHNQRAILDVLSLETNRDGCSLRDIQEVTRIPIATVHRALSTMIQFGYVIKNGGNGYRITDDGAKLSGLEQKSDPGDPGDPRSTHKNDSQKSVRGSVDHVDQRIALFDTPQPKRNHYQEEM